MSHVSKAASCKRSCKAVRAEYSSALQQIRLTQIDGFRFRTFFHVLRSDPPCLGDWYTLLDHGKLEELTKDPTSLTGEALADASASNRLTDLVDVFYIMRQSSTLRPHAIIAKARDILMGNESLPLLDRAGLTVFVSGFLKLAEKAKVDCLQEAMDDITGYLPLTRQEQYLYKCDCFYKKLADGAAAPEAAKNISKELLKEAFNAIETGKTQGCPHCSGTVLLQEIACTP